MAPKVPNIEKLNTYWFKMKPGASRTPSFRAMGLLLDCLKSTYKIVKIPGKYEKSIPALKLRRSKPPPRKRKVINPGAGSTKNTNDAETNPIEQKDKDNIPDELHGEGYRDRLKDDDKAARDDLHGEGYHDHPKYDDKAARDDPQHVEVRKSKRVSEAQRKKPRQVEYASVENGIKKTKKKKGQPSTTKSVDFNSMSPIKNEGGQESPEFIEQNEEKINGKINLHNVNLMRGWITMTQIIMSKIPTFKSPCDRDEIKMMYEDKCLLKGNGEECLPFDDVFHHFVAAENQQLTLFRIIETKNKLYIEDAATKRGEMHTRYAFENDFPEIYHDIIENVCNVASDGNCGFRAVAKALNLPKGEEDWPRVRDDMLKEMNDHEHIYRSIMGELKGFDTTRSAVNHRDGGSSGWMFFPEMGLLIATTYNVAVLVLSKEPTTYLPLRQSPGKKKIICLARVEANHFVEVTLKSDPPLPKVTVLWNPNRYEEAIEWESSFQTNFNLYSDNLKPDNHWKVPIKIDD